MIEFSMLMLNHGSLSSSYDGWHTLPPPLSSSVTPAPGDLASYILLRVREKSTTGELRVVSFCVIF